MESRCTQQQEAQTRARAHTHTHTHHATTGSKRRSSKVLGSIREYQAGIDVEGPPITGAWRRRLEKGIAQHVHQKLTRGNVSRAAKAFEASAVAEPTEQVLTQLEVLHPDADPPTVPPPPDVPPQCSRQQLKKILKTLPRGSAPGPSGWTFEHIQAVAQGSREGMDAVLDLVNAVLSGSLPAWEASQSCNHCKTTTRAFVSLHISMTSCCKDLQRPLRLPTSSCLLYTSPSPRDRQKSRMPSSA